MEKAENGYARDNSSRGISEKGKRSRLTATSQGLYKLAHSWKWVKTGDICDGLVPGRTKPKNFDGDLPYLPLAPLNEQRLIVAKIEALTAHSRKAREALLDAIPALLDQFRQSVLAAAFRGDLTEECDRKIPT